MRESQLIQTIEDLISHGERKGIRHQETAREILHQFYDLRIDSVPESYMRSCDCHDWAASIKHMVFQHKPGCPQHDVRCEFVLLANHRHNTTMHAIRSGDE